MTELRRFTWMTQQWDTVWTPQLVLINQTWGKLVRCRGTRQSVGAVCVSTSVCSLWMSGCCCVLRAWVCLLPEPQCCWDGRGFNVCVRRDGEGACVERRGWGSWGAHWRAHDMVRESHTPWSTAVQRRVSRSCWETSQPLETAQLQAPQARRASRHSAAGILLGTLFWMIFFHLNSLSQALVYLWQWLRMTHQKEITIYPSAGAAACSRAWCPLDTLGNTFVF